MDSSWMRLLAACALLRTTSSAAWRAPRKVSHQGVSGDVVIDKPAGTEFDVPFVHHDGTVRR
jgi:hypothetical protein